MGLLGNLLKNNKYEEIDTLYKGVKHNSYDRETLIEVVDKLMATFDGMSQTELNEFVFQTRLGSKKDKTIRAFTHPVYGFFFEDRLIDNIRSYLAGKKAAALKAKAMEAEFDSIQFISPTTDNDYRLERKKTSELPEIKISNITKSFNIDKIPTFVVIDIETTGLKFGRDRIIEISAIRFEKDGPTEGFSSLINPGVSIPKDASDINGITDEDVMDAPSLQEVAGSFIEFIGVSPIVGHNVSFDLSFLFCAGVDLLKKRKIFDTKALAKKVHKDELEYYSLENVLALYGVSVKQLHQSYADCYATGYLFLEMVRKLINS